MKKGNIFSQEKVETVIFIKREKNCSYRQHKRKEKKRKDESQYLLHSAYSFCLRFGCCAVFLSNKTLYLKKHSSCQKFEPGFTILPNRQYEKLERVLRSNGTHFKSCQHSGFILDLSLDKLSIHNLGKALTLFRGRLFV